MSNPMDRIEDQLPYHYREEYPLFITFLKKYYEWMYRTNLSPEEVDYLRSDTSWMNVDIDKFIDTKQSRYISSSVDKAINELSNVPSPGRASNLLVNNISLNVTSSGLLDHSNSQMNDVNNNIINVQEINKEIINRRFLTMGYDPIEIGDRSLDSIDRVLMISLLKHLYSIKGTAQSISIFFNLFFGVDVSVIYPKFNIATIDDHFVLDGTDVMRDDYYYDEFSYAITVATPITSRYLDIFENIYMKSIHPSGFRSFLSGT